MRKGHIGCSTSRAAPATWRWRLQRSRWRPRGMSCSPTSMPRCCEQGRSPARRRRRCRQPVDRTGRCREPAVCRQPPSIASRSRSACATSPTRTPHYASMRRVLKPGGKLLILEFSKPVEALAACLRRCTPFNVLPVLGQTGRRRPQKAISTWPSPFACIRIPGRTLLANDGSRRTLSACRYRNLAAWRRRAAHRLPRSRHYRGRVLLQAFLKPQCGPRC